MRVVCGWCVCGLLCVLLVFVVGAWCVVVRGACLMRAAVAQSSDSPCVGVGGWASVARAGCVVVRGCCGVFVVCVCGCGVCVCVCVCVCSVCGVFAWFACACEFVGLVTSGYGVVKSHE